MRMTRPLVALAAASLAAVFLTVPAAHASAAAEPGSATVVPIQVTGDPAGRFNLVILGDGYTAAEQPKFRADIDKH